MIACNRLCGLWLPAAAGTPGLPVISSRYFVSPQHAERRSLFVLRLLLLLLLLLLGACVPYVTRGRSLTAPTPSPDTADHGLSGYGLLCVYCVYETLWSEYRVSDQLCCSWIAGYVSGQPFCSVCSDWWHFVQRERFIDAAAWCDIPCYDPSCAQNRPAIIGWWNSRNGGSDVTLRIASRCCCCCCCCCTQRMSCFVVSSWLRIACVRLLRPGLI